MLLRSSVQVITKIKKPTKAVFFRQFKVGDTFVVSTLLVDPGMGRNRYAVPVRVYNITQEIHHGDSITNISNRFENFEYEPVIR